MKKIISSIIFIFSVALLSIFITILVSENSNIVSYLYKDKIVKEVEDKISLNVNFNDLRVKWEGLNLSSFLMICRFIAKKIIVLF